MKKIILVVSFFCSVLVAQSQNLTVEGTAPNLYITHTVAPKENFYSIGRLYNQTAKSIASFNSVVMEKGLAIGQRIKIPLNDQNLDVNGTSGETVPLTRIVSKSETLSKIGTDLNVSAQSIKQWNKLSSDNIAPGTPLVVGHLKMSSTPGNTKAALNASVNDQPIASKQEPVAEVKQVAAELKKDESAAAPVVKPEPVKQAETVGNPPVKEALVKQDVTKAEDTKKSETYSYSTTNSLGSIEGVFANVFTTEASLKSINNKSGEAATFKSTSGWQDKKYYVLMNDVAPGTIVKIASMENKTVYAKVLGSMPDMKENNGLLLRISNSAASHLGIIDPKFPVQISYYQ
ncbi:LysM peptidoglycan-binding domain-containing protein [Segetibacter sp.]|jgi:LysM repeat protein|uniref:LysM peptidoglycan-binding domain-containing protein n=1 Tax=Segetibacter sp. TaxID=2231182 RepID=UPI0026376053|nr:LysM peptidoglycan-binding domain-containing protein [Segetibacter sp.]MCW3081919.1 LysM peptidoglycan-binding protein [Segetibacter sp.]